MTQLAIAAEAFHFLRPAWLVLLPAVLLLWWRIRRGSARRDIAGEGIAPHLRAALTLGDTGRGRIQPIDAAAAAMILLLLGAAGPTWSRMPDPQAAEAAPVAVVMAVTSSMEGADIAPSRLERARQKTRDFLDRRGGARTGLIAYAGSAHAVVPMTADTGIMVPYLAGLSSQIMPRPGNDAGAALALAGDLLAPEGAGAILLITDAVDPADVAAIEAAPMPVAVLAMLPEGTRDRGIDDLSVPVVQVTPDDADIARLDRRLNAAWRAALLENTDQPWEDRGPWLAWPAAVLLMLWFRRGWTMRWAVLALGLAAAPDARAEGIADWFWTPDQQGQRAMDRKDFEDAAGDFADPLLRGYALYRDGQYAEAIEILDRVETAQAAMIQGISQIRARGYRDAVAAFETALARDPDYPGAAENLQTARDIVTYIEDVQDASGTEDDTEMTADEVAFDNEENRGDETRQEVPRDGEGEGPLSADQWMSGVETETADFLRQRFALEAAAGPRDAAQDPDAAQAPDGTEAPPPPAPGDSP
ncbi:VWA domain-containing protein [Mangrovicoccus algicola]|uniref:VWA domain-containing protein n=1 Tax=Mangrovicoccus algicola TaxID=2771008 RepID=A0A8J6YXS2_9RHOB|nr:VWA domain-containing protein [Mangrovicoccus algicola]MBE3639682.1 VWA domain-containing protein [Mangrovicoccus algicola]